MVDELETMAGRMMESLFRDTAREASTTLDVAGKALATQRAVAWAVGKENPEQTEADLAAG